MEMVKNYDYYQMQVRHYDSLLLRLMDQFEVFKEDTDCPSMFQAMSTLSNKASMAERNRLWIRNIIKRHVQTLRSNLERC